MHTLRGGRRPRLLLAIDTQASAPGRSRTVKGAGEHKTKIGDLSHNVSGQRMGPYLRTMQKIAMRTYSEVLGLARMCAKNARLSTEKGSGARALENGARIPSRGSRTR